MSKFKRTVTMDDVEARCEVRNELAVLERLKAKK